MASPDAERHHDYVNTYNHLNQPKEIMVSNETYSGSISYLYDAQGNKLQKQVTENRQTQTTDYLGGFQYQDGVLDFVPHAEGYVKAVHTGSATEYHYVYNYTDHLGNIRLSYTRDPETDEVAILKESHYYPFGLQHKGYVSTHQVFPGFIEAGKVELLPVRNYLDDSYRYTFGGKEEQLELGLNWMDFHARNYMPDIVRTMTMDPLAEKFISLSPYSFLNNNPLRNIDPTGASTIELTGAAAQDFFQRLKNEINSKRDKEKEGDIEGNLGNGGDEKSNSQDSDENNPQQQGPVYEADWSQVFRGSATVVGGSLLTIGGVIATASGVATPVGVGGIILGPSTVGLGVANVIEGFRGGKEYPLGPMEAIDIGFGGDGTMGQMGDVFSGGLPKNITSSIIMSYGFYNSNIGQKILNNPKKNNFLINSNLQEYRRIQIDKTQVRKSTINY